MAQDEKRTFRDALVLYVCSNVHEQQCSPEFTNIWKILSSLKILGQSHFQRKLLYYYILQLHLIFDTEIVQSFIHGQINLRPSKRRLVTMY